MGPLAYLRRRREHKQLAEKVLTDIKLIEGTALSRPFNSTNNYFACAFMLLNVENAIKHRDHESLVVYDRYLHLPYQYEAVQNALKALRSLGSIQVSGTITDEHVRLAYRLRAAYVEHPRYDPFSGSKEYDAMLELVYSNMEQAERIIMMVTDRGVTDAVLISELIQAGDGVVAPLIQGEL